MSKRALKLQVSVDFLSSYGVALAIIFVAIAAVYALTIAPNNPGIFCTAVPGFSCGFISVNSTGVLTLKLAQATGSQITINGVACSTNQGNADTPAYGNIGVNSMKTYYETPKFYPPGNVLYSGSSYILRAYCYNYAGIAKGTTGKPFSGIVWLNYTIPTYGQVTQKVVTFSAVYS